ncbi:MAG: radical SAM protein [bacterium]
MESSRPPGGQARVFLVFPYDKLGTKGCFPPLSLLYLGTSLASAGYDVRLFDADEDNLSLQESRMIAAILAQAGSFRPALIGLPVYSMNLRLAYRIVQALREASPDWRIVLGGPHPTVMPAETLSEFPGADFVLRGEAERSILGLMKALDGCGDYSGVAGLSYRSDGKVLHNPDAPLIRDINQVPFPARQLLQSAYDKGTYWRIGRKGPLDVMITSRGCPFNCNFCYHMTPGYRARSPESVLDEIAEIRSRGVRNIDLLDDNFTLDRKRCTRILDFIVREKMGLSLKIRSSVNTVDEELLRLMKRAGVGAILYGFESGSETMLRRMGKKATVKQNARIVELHDRYKIQCYAGIIIGYPGETLETLQETRDFLLKVKPTGVNISIMIPLPGTRAYEEAKADGTLVGDWSVHAPDPWIRLPWAREYRDYVAVRNKIMKRFMFDPVVVFNLLRYNFPAMDRRQLRYAIGYYLRFSRMNASSNSGFKLKREEAMEYHSRTTGRS